MKGRKQRVEDAKRAAHEARLAAIRQGIIHRGGAHLDRKREADRRACRGPQRHDSQEGT